MTVDPIEMSYLEALIAAEIDDQKNVQLAREYHKGVQTVHLTGRVEQFLALHSQITFRLNICKVITEAVQDELTVVGFDTDEQPKDGGANKPQAGWARDLWNANRMDAVQNDLHEAVLRDREAFVIVDWDKDKGRPRFTIHERFVSTEALGNGTGVWILYENDDINQPAVAAINQWTETVTEGGQRVSRIRRTVYYPDRVERFINDNGTWEHFLDEEGAAWPTPWVDKAGKPLGIPVVHFKNEGLAPETWDALPIQDAINKIAIDVMASADVAGFRIYKAIGFIPTTDGKTPADDGSNWLTIRPGALIGTTKGKDVADFQAIDGADVKPLMDTLMEWISIAASITSTPNSRFVMTRQIAGAETQKQQDKPVKRKAKRRRVLFGNAWEDVMVVARRLNNVFGSKKLKEDVSFSTVWEHSESLDELKEKRDALGIPEPILWEEAGYSQEQITNMQASAEYRMKLEMILWGVVKAGLDAGVPFETIVRRLGMTTAEVGVIGTEKLAAIKLQQEDVVPPVEQ